MQIMKWRCSSDPKYPQILTITQGVAMHRKYQYRTGLHRGQSYASYSLEHWLHNKSQQTALRTDIKSSNVHSSQYLHRCQISPSQEERHNDAMLSQNSMNNPSHTDSATNSTIHKIRNQVDRATGKSNGTISQKLLWYRTNEAQRPKVATLIDRFDSVGMEVQICDVVRQDATANDFQMNWALIMLECIEIIELEMLARLEQIRAQSNAPLVVLTDNSTLDWSLLALREGADAIFTMNTPDEVILARSVALLRRWGMS